VPRNRSSSKSGLSSRSAEWTSRSVRPVLVIAETALGTLAVLACPPPPVPAPLDRYPVESPAHGGELRSRPGDLLT
jgi:hypothetical protein